MNINNYGSDASPSLLPWKVGETKYTLMQAFPLWGKRELKRDAAAADVRVQTHDGRDLHIVIEHAIGSTQRPMSEVSRLSPLSCSTLLPAVCARPT